MSTVQSRTRSNRRMDSVTTTSALGTSRITRSKKIPVSTGPPASAKSFIQAPPPKRRAALEDLSNVSKLAPAASSSSAGKPLVYSKSMISKQKPASNPALEPLQQTTTTTSSVSADACNTTNPRRAVLAAKSHQPSQHRVAAPRPKPSTSNFHVHTSENIDHSSILPLKRTADESDRDDPNDHNDNDNNDNNNNNNNNNNDPQYNDAALLLQEHDRLVAEQAQEDADAELRAVKRARTQPWEDLDAEDIDDPLMVSEYVNDIFDYFYTLELKYMPDPDYMDQQRDITWETRGVLMDWLVEIHTKLRLLPETLFLAFNVIDRFMTMRVVTLDKIQLVGIAALLIAAKYEEVFPPAVKYFAMLTEDNFKEDEILSAERFLLQVLGFQLSYPNPLNFLRRISKADNYDVRTRSFGKYFLELAAVDHRLLGARPSHIAAASMYLSRKIANGGSLKETEDDTQQQQPTAEWPENTQWTANLEHYAGDVSEAALEPIVRTMMASLAQREVPYVALFKKYASRRYFKASVVARQWAKDNMKAYF